MIGITTKRLNPLKLFSGTDAVVLGLSFFPIPEGQVSIPMASLLSVNSCFEKGCPLQKRISVDDKFERHYG